MIILSKKKYLQLTYVNERWINAFYTSHGRYVAGLFKYFHALKGAER
jgi:hypothetical protein